MIAKPTIVILGDWFIDENWLVSPLNLYHSAGTGKIHYLARHRNTTEKVTNLCASASLLETIKLYLSAELKEDVPDFLAFGAWNPQDNDLIRRILCRHNQETMRLSQYTLSNTSTSLCDYCKNVSSDCSYSNILVNLASAESDDVSTNRVIRCFQGHGGAMPEQLYRFDWMLPLRLDASRYSQIRKMVSPRNVVAVVIVDHGAGVVNNESINQLFSAVKNKNARWFVRAKIDHPSWMNVLKKKGVTVEINVADFRLANKKKGERRLWHYHHLGRAALELLGEMTGSYIYSNGKFKDLKDDDDLFRAKTAVMFFDNNTAFGITEGDRQKKQFTCISINQSPGGTQIMNLGRTTIFCASLFAQRLRAILENEDDLDSGVRLGWECSQALRSAYRWSQRASEKWSREELSLYDNYEHAIANIRKPPGRAELTNEDERDWKEWDYDRLWQEWNDSSKNLGIIIPSDDVRSNAPAKEVLQLWRGYGVLGGYICVGGPKRDSINHLVSSIGTFKADSWTHSLCCLITSPPGWGKSFLAKSLASYFAMDFLEFSIAQMCDNRDVMDCFATIASTQSKSERPTLVFIDEVNAKIEGHSALPLLLSPIWGGVFVKDRQSLRLRPSVWIFASTSNPTEISDKEESKASDFLSRLNGPIIALDSGRQHWGADIIALRDALYTGSENIYRLAEYKRFEQHKADSLSTEQVYLLVSLLNQRWGPVNRIERQVLELFRDLLPINGSRSLEIFTASFEGIRLGEVRRANVPRIDLSVELQRHIIFPPGWPRNTSDGTELVEIETRVR